MDDNAHRWFNDLKGHVVAAGFAALLVNEAFKAMDLSRTIGWFVGIGAYVVAAIAFRWRRLRRTT